MPASLQQANRLFLLLPGVIALNYSIAEMALIFFQVAVTSR
jgi:hypothetical protein